MSEQKGCKIINTISAQMSKFTIVSPNNKVLIGIEGHSIFKYCLITKRKCRLVGSVYGKGCIDGHKHESKFNTPKGLVLSKDGSALYVSDSNNHRIRKVCLKTYITTTISNLCDFPSVLKMSVDGNLLYVVDMNTIQEINLLSQQSRKLVVCGDNPIISMEICPNGKDILFGTPTKMCKINISQEKDHIINICRQFSNFIIHNYTISLNFQFVFITTNNDRYITVLNIADYSVFHRIHLDFEPHQITLDNNSLYIVQNENSDIIIIDIPNIIKDFKMSIQSAIHNYSYLSRGVIKRLSI
jgi:DNA-binding beta-propeller fold protein YncE